MPDFLIIQGLTDDLIDPVTAFLEADPRIAEVGYETGTYYATPDRDDLPEWHSLSFSADVSDPDGFLQELAEAVAEHLDAEARAKLTFRRL